VTAYCDSSALVKLVVHEAESEALVDQLSGPITAVTSALSLAEVTRALRRVSLPREDVESALVGFYLVEVTRPILEQAGWIATERVRSLDAIHLATALSMGIADLQFITYDERLADAARTQGLRVVQPGRGCAA
jgi:predicted nucleic acid-binding protein